jgi:hypothetical protein
MWERKGVSLRLPTGLFQRPSLAGLVEWYKQSGLTSGQNLLVVADQFEEIFRFQDSVSTDEVEALVGLLVAAATQRNLPIYVVITMRSDFLGDCSRYDGLLEMMNKGVFFTPRLTREECRQAIEGPAAGFHLQIETQLVNRLLNDVDAGHTDQLPVVQHMLMRLWRRASYEQQLVLRLHDYDSLGGTGGAISHHGDEVYDSLTLQQQKLAIVLFQSLCEIDENRSVRRASRLDSIAEVTDVPLAELLPVVEAFRAPECQFLAPPYGETLRHDTIIDINHESILRQWARIPEWARWEREDAQIYRRLVDSAEDWNRGLAGVWPAAQLDLVVKWYERRRSNRAWARRYGGDFDLAMSFLRACQRAKSRRLLTRVLTLAVGLAVIAVGFVLKVYH